MNRFAQSTSAFAMNDADIKDSPLPAFRKIMRNQLFYFTGIKCMEVERSINEHFNRFKLSIFSHSLSMSFSMACINKFYHDLLVLKLKIFAHLENFDTIEDKGLK